jgi:subtilisin-like proprotein convertase family protein
MRTTPSTRFVRGLSLLALVTGAVGLAGPAEAAPLVLSGSGVTIADKAVAAPSTITVPVTDERVTDVDVTLTGLTHPLARDLDIVLQGPDGRSIALASDAGYAGGLSGHTVTFDDDASATLPYDGAWPEGSVRPTDHPDTTLMLGVDADSGPGGYEAPAPTGGATLASVFGGSDPSGEWTLYVSDDCLIGAGSLAGWSLSLTTEPVPEQAPPAGEPDAPPAGEPAEPQGDEPAHEPESPKPDKSELEKPQGDKPQADEAEKPEKPETPPAVAPELATAPVSVTVAEGADATFTAAATGEPAPAVQWQLLDADGVWADVEDATEATLTVPQVRAAQDQLTVRAVFANDAGSVTSEPVVLTVE